MTSDPPAAAADAAAPESKGPREVPALVLRHGAVVRSGPNGAQTARGPDGSTIDPFDVVDRLAERYSLLFLVDLDGIERNEPQVEYLQEFAREIPMWVDAGTRTADQSIDILVTGARRVVLSTAFLAGPEELERTWSLTAEVAFEIETRAGRPASRPEWGAADVAALARSARALGVRQVVIAPDGGDPDWAVVAELARDGPTWVRGPAGPPDPSRLAAAGARGGIFPIDALLDELGASR